MRGTVIMRGARILAVMPRASSDGAISWTEATFMDSNFIVSTVTVDKTAVQDLKPGTVVDLKISISEEPSVSRRSRDPYLATKFRIVGVESAEE